MPVNIFDSLNCLAQKMPESSFSNYFSEKSLKCSTQLKFTSLHKF